MGEILVHVIRGDAMESSHAGSAVVVDAGGHVLYEIGEPHQPIYSRSCMKPVQAIPMILTGTADRYELTDREIAVCCASHNGEPMHIETVTGMMSKAGLDLDRLHCGVHAPYSVEAYEQLLLGGRTPEPVHNNCSGKHAGMLLTAQNIGADLSNYTHREHEVQQSVMKQLSMLSGLQESEIPTGLDGCGLPTHLLPLEHLALVFARLAAPDKMPDDTAQAIKRIVHAMFEHPEMIGGTGEFDTVLMQQMKGRVIGKVGAEGVFCMALPKQGLGIAIKIDDGNRRGAYPAAVEILEQLGVLEDQDRAALAEFHKPIQKNNRDEEAGRLIPVFRLIPSNRMLQNE
ncbi:asparaginase [Paenibacillus sp. Z6-24]